VQLGIPSMAHDNSSAKQALAANIHTPLISLTLQNQHLHARAPL
jgi:hypothetical protein